VVADDSTHAETNAEFGRGAHGDPVVGWIHALLPGSAARARRSRSTVSTSTRSCSGRAGSGGPALGTFPQAVRLTSWPLTPRTSNGQWPHVRPSWRHAAGTNP